MVYSPKNFWNRYATKYQRSWDKPKNYKELDSLIDCMSKYLESFSEILDVGSGWGRFLLRCRIRRVDKFFITMCDISDTYIEQAFENTGQQPDLWDDEKLPYEDNSFDLVVAQSVLLHVKPELIEQVWSELLRVSSCYIYIASLNVEVTEKRIKEDKVEDIWCFAHDYSKLIDSSDVKILETFKFSDQRTAWWLEKVE